MGRHQRQHLGSPIFNGKLKAFIGLFILELSFRLLIQLRDQVELPLIQDFGSDGGEIGAGQHKEHLQRFARADFGGKPHNGVLATEVVAKCCVGHDQMFVNQEDYDFAFGVF